MPTSDGYGHGHGHGHSHGNGHEQKKTTHESFWNTSPTLLNLPMWLNDKN